MSMTKSFSCLLCIVAIAQGSLEMEKEGSDAYNDHSTEVRANNSFNTNSESDSISCKKQLEMCQEDKDDVLYSLYKKLEASLIGNPAVLHKLRQVFFPITGTHIQEVGRAHFTVTFSALCHKHQQKCCISQFNETFIWTTSPLMSMVTIDQFLIIDSVITPTIFGRTATAMTDYTVLIPFEVKDLQCPPQDEQVIVQALVHLLSWVKAYARADGKPDTLEERDKGYIVKYYDYYTTESLYKMEYHDHARHIRMALLVIVACLNIIIPAGFAFGGAQQLQKMLIPERFHTGNSIKKAIVITVVLSNMLYVLHYILSIMVHSGSNSSLLICLISLKRDCIVPINSTLYWDEVATMVSVYSLVPTAVIFELIIAIVLQVRMRYKSIKSKSITNHCCKAFLLWNVMTLVQICIGLILIPSLMFLIIAPADTISFLGCFGLLQVYASLTIKYIFLDVKCRMNCKSCLLFLVKLLVCLVLLTLAVALGMIYFEILEVGISLRTLQGLFLSLFPSFILTMVAWVIRKKLVNNKRSVTKWHQFDLKSIHIPGEEHQCLLESEDESDTV